MCAYLDAITFSGLASEEEDGHAREEAGDEAAQEAALAQVLGVAVHQAGCAESSTAALNCKKKNMQVLYAKLNVKT